MLVQNLDRLNDNVREESDGIHNTLSIIENLVNKWWINNPFETLNSAKSYGFLKLLFLNQTHSGMQSSLHSDFFGDYLA